MGIERVEMGIEGVKESIEKGVDRIVTILEKK